MIEATGVEDKAHRTDGVQIHYKSGNQSLKDATAGALKDALLPVETALAKACNDT